MIYHTFVQLAVFEKKIYIWVIYARLFTYDYGLFNNTTRYLYCIVLNIRVMGDKWIGKYTEAGRNLATFGKLSFHVHIASVPTKSKQKTLRFN